MILKKITILILLSMGFLPSISAQETESKTIYELSIEEACSLAVERNITLRNAGLEIQKAEMQKWQAISSMLPQVSAKLDYSNMLGYEMEFSTGPITSSIAMPPSAQIGVTAAAAVSGAQIISTQLSDIAIEMANISQAKSEQEISSNVKLLYYSALLSEQTVALLEKNLLSMNDLYNYSLSSVEAGVAEQVDADQILVQVASVQTSINSALRSVEMIYNSMRILLNLDASAELVLSDSIESLVKVDETIALTLEGFELERNFDYQLLSKNVELSKKQVSMKAWDFGPQLSVFYQYTGKTYFSDEPTMNMTPPNMVGISLSVPIFSSGMRTSALKSAKLDYQKQVNTLEETSNSLVVQHQQLIFDMRSAYDTYSTQLQNVAVSQRVFDNISKKYEYGRSSSMDVTTSGTNLIGAQASYVQSLLEFVNAQIALEKLLNK